MSTPRKAWSDDRDLLGTSGDKPYIFFIIDTSSSMRRFTGDEWVPGANDDPNSKVYQAKKAIYEVIEQVGDNALYGFATFDIANADPIDRHWLYTLESNPSWFSDPEFTGGSDTRPWIGPGTSEVAYPRVGHPLLFGDDSSHDDLDPAKTDDDHMDGSCQYPENLDVEVADPVEGLGGAAHARNANKTNWTDTRALGQMWSFAKLGRNGDTDTIQWFKYKTRKYRLTWKALTGGQLGDVSLTVDVILEREGDGDCGTIAFDKMWEEPVTLVPMYTQDLDGDPFTTSPTEVIAQHSRSRGWLSEGDYNPTGACSADLFLESNNDPQDVGKQFSYDVIPDPLGRDPDNGHTRPGRLHPPRLDQSGILRW